MQELGKGIFIVGAVLCAVGLVVWLGGARSPIGRLPGDINVSRENFSFHFPIVTCLLISIGMSFLVWLLGKLRQ
jgi:hypothetical protein